MSGLLEALLAVSLSGAVLVLMTTSISAAARLHAACAQLGDEAFASRQLEHLVDRATLRAGAGPNHPAAVASVTADTVVLASDQDGNGAVDATTSETTAVEVRQDGRTARVRVRLGRQTMTVLDAGNSLATMSVRDRRGDLAAASAATLLELAIRHRDDDSPGRQMLFSLPARSIP